MKILNKGIRTYDKDGNVFYIIFVRRDWDGEDTYELTFLERLVDMDEGEQTYSELNTLDGCIEHVKEWYPHVSPEMIKEYFEADPYLGRGYDGIEFTDVSPLTKMIKFRDAVLNFITSVNKASDNGIPLDVFCKEHPIEIKLGNDSIQLESNADSITELEIFMNALIKDEKSIDEITKQGLRDQFDKDCEEMRSFEKQYHYLLCDMFLNIEPLKIKSKRNKKYFQVYYELDILNDYILGVNFSENQAKILVGYLRQGFYAERSKND